jgi:predicted Fe-Mo cluster-binding NifX family protein
MNILLPSEGKTLKDGVDENFGRCPYFILYNIDTDKWTVHNNEIHSKAQISAGTQGALTAIVLGTDSVITSSIGDKAFTVLKEAKVRVFLSEKTTIKETIDLFKLGELKELFEASNEGHWVQSKKGNVYENSNNNK